MIKVKKAMSDEQKEKNNQKKHEKIQYRKSQGICTTCGKRKSNSNRLQCSECLKEGRIRSAETRRFQKEHHICTRCGKRKAEAERTYCVECTIKRMEEDNNRIRKPLTASRKERAKELRRKKYAERKASGICTRCGKHQPVKGKTRCIDCILFDKKRFKNKKECPNLDRSEYPSYGMCYICGEAVRESGKLCEKHYIAACEAIIYGKSLQNNKEHKWKKHNNALFVKRAVT